MLFTRSFLVTLLALLLLAASFASGYVVHDRINASDSFPIFNQAYKILANHGLKEIPDGPSLEYGMIRGMLQAYDEPYTTFIEPAQHELESDSLNGSFGGIGVQLGNDSEGYWLLYPFPDGPASTAGILEGDRLLAVENMQVSPATPLETIQSAIRGPVGKHVALTIGRPPDFAPVKIAIRRSEIPLPSVTWHLAAGEPRVGILEINLITASTAEEIQRAVKDLQERDAAYFVMDLRDNPGGLLSAGVEIARLFLQEGVIIEQQYRGQPVEVFRVERPGPLIDIPLAVVINQGSASAAEIIAGTLKAHRRAMLVGHPTFGKDTIQLVFDLSDGSSLHVTAAHWWIPGLVPPLSGNGLQPDINISGQVEGAGPDAALQAAIRMLLETN